MLARPGEPFDSDDYLFEIKWDGTRGICFIDGGGSYRLLNRRRIDMRQRYPELAFLGGGPAGTVLDGEIVVLRGGKPDFHALQRREQARVPLKIRHLSRASPATYIVFDQLYDAFRPVTGEPLHARRKRLRETVGRVGSPALLVSEGVSGGGRAYFEEACRQGLEGVVAKRLGSPYLPGKRTDAWVKIKRQETVACAIVGFLPEGEDDFKSLILATPGEGGGLRVVGTVGSGFDAARRAELNRLLRGRLCGRPVVTTKLRGKWVEPGLYCLVRCMERTRGGQLRAPVFERLYGN